MKISELFFETQEYQGQNSFIASLRKNPRVLARHVAAITKMRDAYIAACRAHGVDRLHDASLSLLGNYPHSDDSLESIQDRIGSPDWDECDANPQAAADFALKMLDDAVDHPIDWDCIAGSAMRFVMGRYDPFYT